MRMLTLFLVLFVAVPSLAARLVSGPMAGPSDHRSVTLWLQADGAARVAVEYWPLEAPAERRRSAPQPLRADEQFVAQLRLSSLKPGSRYAYRVLFDGRTVGDVWQFATQALWQWRRQSPDFTVLAGSCAFGNEPEFDRPGRPYGDRDDIFDRMAAEQADLMLWLGDNIYLREVDWGSLEGMEHRWAYVRRQPALQKLLRTGAHAAIWDDHDFGPDNANRSHPLKHHALALQRRYWPNPSFGLPEAPGAFTSFSLNDAEFFLLDNRWYLDHPKLPAADRQMFGAEQMRWLKNALLNSTARFKLIAGGSQMLNGTSRFSDSWADYPAEREDFLRFLRETGIGGVVFLSGDVHRSELIRLEREGLYALHDLSCSPLTSGTHVNESLRERPQLVPGTLVMGQRNYCRLRFEGMPEERRLVLQVINADGQLQWTHTLSAAQLGAPWPMPRHPTLPRPQP
ncbi:MAG: alkaline phosphatase D family protein [Burkholderiales bacterium]|nr:alkaline phosphatase D family protein [Burkholderiales bacterium]